MTSGGGGQALRAAGHPAGGRCERHSAIAIAVTLIVGALPALYIGWFVARYGVEVPSMDDWEMATIIAKTHAGELTFHDLFKQQEEARMIFPALLFILSGLDRHWDVRDEMMLSVVICAVTTLGVYLLLRRSGLGVVATALCFWVSSFLIFSPAQFELWLFASGLPSFIPVACIIGALLACETRWSGVAKFASCALLATVSTFTLAHGMLAWGLTFPVFLAGHRPPRWKGWLAVWCALAAAAAAAYFYEYRKPPHLPDFASALSAGDYVQFLLAFVGGSLGCSAEQQRVALAVAAGAIACAGLTAAAVYALSRLRDAAFSRQVLPWFAVALYSIASGVLVVLGRGAFGLEYAISSRYVTFSLYALVAVVALLAILRSDMLKRQRLSGARAILAAVILLGTTGSYLYAAHFDNAVRTLHSIAARNRLARSAIVFSPAVDTSAIIKRINYPDPKHAMAQASQLDELRLLRPPLIRTAEIRALPHSEVDEQMAAGWCDAIVPADGDEFRASGWATLNGKGRPADAVLLAYQNAEGIWVAFTMSDVVVRRHDIKKMMRNRDQLWSGWAATFRREAVPPGAPISAWAVDVDEPRLYRLRQNTPELKL